MGNPHHYTLEIRDDGGHREVIARNEAGAPFYGAGDSTGTLPLEALVREVTRVVMRDRSRVRATGL